MKKISFLIIFAIFASLSISAQTESSKKYYHLKGSIDEKYPITMDLFFFNGNLRGSYYYDKVGKSINLNGTLNDDNTFEMTEESYSEEQGNIKTGTFKGKLNQDNSLTGTWQNADKTKELSFEVKENYLHSARIRYYEFSNSFHLKDREDLPSYKISLNYAVPVTAPIRAAYTIMKNNFKESSFGNKDCGSDEECILNGVSAMVNDYNNIGDVSDEEIMEWPSAYEWESDYTIDVYYNDKDFLVMIDGFYEYMGGAHGMSGYGFKIYDLQSGYLWTIDDVFISSKKDALTDVIKQKLIDMELEEELFSLDEVTVTDNIGFDGSGIYFVYNVYEIAPYVTGPIELEFSFKELSDFLTPKFKEKMGL